MKNNKLLILLSLLIVFSFVNKKVLGQNPEGLERILILESYTNIDSCYYFRAALDNLGYVYTNAHSDLAWPNDDLIFRDSIDINDDGIYDGDWDLIIFNYSNATKVNILNALSSYVAQGGLLIMDYLLPVNYTTCELWPAMGFSIMAGPPLLDPISFEATDPGHYLFNYPNTINPVFNWTDDSYAFHGHYLEVDPDAVKVANVLGYTEGIVVINNDRKTIYNSLMPTDFKQDNNANGKPDIIEFFENQILYIGNPVATLSAVAGCETGSVTITSSKGGTQTFYLRDDIGDPISEWTGDTTMHEFTGLINGAYKGQIMHDTRMSSLSDAVLLINNTNTNITTQPNNINATEGDDISFNIVADGTNLTYQWRFNGNDITDATNSTYSLNNVQTSDAGNYDVVVSGTCGNIISDVAVLDVSVSVDDISYFDINLYPNPSYNGIVTINLKDYYKFSVTDVFGKLIISKVINGSSTVKINTKGLYFFKFENEKTRIIKKVIIN